MGGGCGWLRLELCGGAVGIVEVVVVVLRSRGGGRRGGKRCEAVELSLKETSSLRNGGLSQCDLM